MDFVSDTPPLAASMLWRALADLDQGNYLDAAASARDAIASVFPPSRWQALTATTLAAAAPLPRGGALHWVRFDADQNSAAFLHGWDSTLVRPWVIWACVPGPAVAGGWEVQLQAAGYTLVHLNGAQRLYLAREQAHLQPALMLAPGMLAEAGAARASAAAARAAAAELALARLVQSQQESEAHLQARLAHLDDALESARIDADRARHALSELHQSTSWRLTAPLRFALRAARWGLRLPRRAAGWLRRRLRPAAPPLTAPAPRVLPPAVPHQPSLTPRAARVYADLVSGIEQQSN